MLEHEKNKIRTEHLDKKMKKEDEYKTYKNN